MAAAANRGDICRVRPRYSVPSNSGTYVPGDAGRVLPSIRDRQAAASKAGKFAFTTIIVPSDCIGTLSDGTSSIDVRIDGCSGVTPGLPATGR